MNKGILKKYIKREWEKYEEKFTLSKKERGIVPKLTPLLLSQLCILNKKELL